MNKLRRVSIIVPVYNNEEYIESCLESIVCQTFRDFELIVIDGNSKDNTKKLIEKYKDDIDYFVSESDNGIYDAMNKGIKKANGEWYLFLGSDDRLFGAHILNDIFCRSNYDNNKIIFGNIFYDNNEKFISSLDWRVLFRNTLHHQSAFYNKSVFKDREFNSEYSIIADYEINLIAYLQKYKVKYIDVNVAQCSEFGVSKNVDLKGYIEEIAIRKKHLGFVCSSVLNVFSLLKFTIKKLKQ